MSRPRSSPLVQALAGPEQNPALQLRTGTVRAVNTSLTPHELELDIGGVTVTEVCYLFGWAAEVGATVQVLQQGPLLLVLGPLAPGRVVVGAHNHTTPPTDPAPPPLPPAPEPAPSVRKTVAVTAVASATFVPSFGNWRDDKVIQGGTGQRGFWFYGSKIATAKGAGLIVSGSVFIKRARSGGVSGAANVRLGTHPHTAQPGSGAAALDAVGTVGTLLQGQGKTFPLTTAQIDALNAGAGGVGLEPGASGYVTADYLIAEPRAAGDWSGSLTLTVET